MLYNNQLAHVPGEAIVLEDTPEKGNPDNFLTIPMEVNTQVFELALGDSERMTPEPTPEPKHTVPVDAASVKKTSPPKMVSCLQLFV